MQSHYHSLNDDLRARFGQRVVKLSLNAYLGCPHRDPVTGEGGCTFCGEGSGHFAGTGPSLWEQLSHQKALLSHKWPHAAYIAYFQAYTNTYAPVEILRALYDQALAFPGVVGLAIATRPDCLGPEVLDLLSQYQKKTFLWVELGFQTSRQDTALRIRRGYPNAVYDQAALALQQRHIPLVTHLIFGLPGETPEDMLASVDYVCARPIWGIKLQLLHVLRHTALGKQYEQAPFPLLSQEEYIRLLTLALPRIPWEVVIHRLTGDGPKQDLIGPAWSKNKKAVLNALHQAFLEKKIRQGSAVPVKH